MSRTGAAMARAEASPLVYVVDDDRNMRLALSSLFRSAGLVVEMYASAGEFLEARRPEVPGCLILDVRMPGLSGPDLQREMITRGIHIPIIFLSGHAEVPLAVEAIKAGAVEFLIKPFSEDQLLTAVQKAVDRDRIIRQDRAELDSLRDRFATLTPREKEVMAHVVRGLLNKQIAGELGTSEVTVKLHRGRVMHKMSAGSVADLVRMAQKDLN